jgi:6,7-dimethyl-8-ribityllumazine synthase
MASEAPDIGAINVHPDWKIVIVRSVWYDNLTKALVSDAAKVLIDAGIKKNNISVIDAPGSFEIPLLCKEALKDADGAIAFGIIVEGATHHARLIADQAAAGIMQTQLELAKPIVFEVIYVNDVVDAEKRTIGKDAKGGLAARTLLSSLAQLQKLRS